MKYYNPSTVFSPRDCIEKVHVLFDGGHGSNPYSLAMVTWQGVDCIGIRWNVNQREWNHPLKKAGTEICLGEPNSRGYPTWFILPTDLLSGLMLGDGEFIEAIKTALDTMNKPGRNK